MGAARRQQAKVKGVFEKMLNDLIFRLCSTFAGAGNERKIADQIQKEMQEYADEIQIDKCCNVVCTVGEPTAKRHVLVDAHIDQISMVVTAVANAGFITIAPCGGVDCRVLPGATVLVHGKEIVRGIVCMTPPHLATKEKTDFAKTEDLLIDTGLSGQAVRGIVSVGDYVSFNVVPQKLLGSRITAPALDNRAGVATLICCAQMLKDKPLNCCVSFLFSVQEEVRALGAKTATFLLNPTEAISVDVSFATQPNVDEEKSGKLSQGPMIGVAPSLSRDISNQLEIMNGATGTTSDVITSSKSGIPGGLLSIPLKYMHTPVELIDTVDVENTAKLLAQYILEGGPRCDH